MKLFNLTINSNEMIYYFVKLDKKYFKKEKLDYLLTTNINPYLNLNMYRI